MRAINFGTRPRGVAQVQPMAPTQIVADGIWTWFTDPRAVYRNGATYIMAVDSAGTCRVHKYTHATQNLQSVNLSSVGLEVDDHDNGSLFFLADGRIVAFYGTHNDPVIRYKISTSPEDITSWSAEQQRGTGQGSYSYPLPQRYTNDSRDWVWNRRWTDGSGSTRNLSYRTSPDLGTVPATISALTDVWSVAGKIPYWRLVHDGVSKMHAFVTDMHPVSGQSSLYHFEMRLAGGTATWHQSDGTTISASLPLGPGDVTQVYDGSATKCWVSDAAIGSDGAPRVLYMRYPGNNGSAIEYWHARWSGSAWVKTKIADDGAGLYSPEVYYHGGLAFDSMDANRVWLSAPVSGVRQVQEWTTSDQGASWAKVRDLTSGGTAGNPLRLRPYSPREHNGEMAVLWCSGTYTTFTNYNTSVWGAG